MKTTITLDAEVKQRLREDMMPIVKITRTQSRTPDADDSTPPELFPEPSNLPVKGLTVQEKPMTDLKVATEILWGSILQRVSDPVTAPMD